MVAISWYDIIITVDATALGNAFFGQGNSLPINLDNVQCTGEEASIIDCIFSDTNNCGHYEDAGIRCQDATPIPPGEALVAVVAVVAAVAFVAVAVVIVAVVAVAVVVIVAVVAAVVTVVVVPLLVVVLVLCYCRYHHTVVVFKVFL